MFDVSKTAENRLDIQISGSLDSAAMRQLLNELETAASDFSNGKMLYTISHFTMPTLGAMAVEFGHLPKLFGLIGKFDKCAVIADASWIQAVANFEGALIPGLSIKAYDPDQVAQAEAWLAEDA